MQIQRTEVFRLQKRSNNLQFPVSISQTNGETEAQDSLLTICHWLQEKVRTVRTIGIYHTINFYAWSSYNYSSCLHNSYVKCRNNLETYQNLLTSWNILSILTEFPNILEISVSFSQLDPQILPEITQMYPSPWDKVIDADGPWLGIHSIPAISIWSPFHAIKFILHDSSKSQRTKYMLISLYNPDSCSRKDPIQMWDMVTQKGRKEPAKTLHHWP